MRGEGMCTGLRMLMCVLIGRTCLLGIRVGWVSDVVDIPSQVWYDVLMKNLNPQGNILPEIDFTQVNGNAYALMGAWKTAAKREGWTEPDIKLVLDEAMSGTYDELLRTLLSVTDHMGADS